MRWQRLLALFIAACPFLGPWCAYAQGIRIVGDGMVVSRSQREAAIREALTKTIELDAKEMDLNHLVEVIESAFDINVELDTKALDIVGIGADTPITHRINKISLASALRLILRDLELTYMIDEESLLITTQEEAEANLLVAIYPVHDLVLSDITSRPLVYSPEFQRAVNFEKLIRVIMITVAPDTWDQVGGPGSIEPIQYADRYALVISQTEDIHEKIAETLEQLRKVEQAPQALKSDKARQIKVGANKTSTPADADGAFLKVYPVFGRSAKDLAQLETLVRDAIEFTAEKPSPEFVVRGNARAIMVQGDLAIHNQVFELLVGLKAIEPPEPAFPALPKHRPFVGSPVPVVGELPRDRRDPGRGFGSGVRLDR